MKKIRTFIWSAIIGILMVTSIYSQNKYELLRDKIGQSFMNLFPDSIRYETELKSRKWNYEQGLILEAFRQYWLSTFDNKYLDYIQKNIDHYVKNDGSINSYKLDEYNIDQVAPGRSLLFLYQVKGLEKYKIAADTLRKQLQEHPRTKEGGFWHKKIYPFQMWLDGLYMGEPFYAMYTKFYGKPDAFDDIANQFIYIYNHTKDPKTGLLYHAWDESHEQKWANPKTGVSPNFWGRALGWYVMAIVDVLDFLPPDHPKREKLIGILRDVCSAIVKVKDSKTGLWYQVLDAGKKKGNYLEASGSCMFIYAFAKGVNKGYIDPKYGKIAETSFDGVMKYLTDTDKNGNINLLHTCLGAGLGGNPYRDGSYEYYINEKQRTNDFKGYGSLLLSANELARLKKRELEKGKTIGLDYFYNNEWKDGKRYHYIWEDDQNSGFQELGNLFSGYGAKITAIKSFPSIKELDRLSVYIIVDPDTPQETAKPNYIDEKAIENISSWVKKGGVLVLLANDSNNCEFKNLNNLAEKFGITFNGDSKNRVTGKNYDMGAFTNLPDHELFKGVSKIYMKEISTLTIKEPAKAILKDKNYNIVAVSNIGNGTVLAIGDPWLYNEYFDNRKLPGDFENYKAAENLVKWLLKKSNKVK
jgi:unsaturated rhamnogalacturonyl hydrolase